MGSSSVCGCGLLQGGPIIWVWLSHWDPFTLCDIPKLTSCGYGFLTKMLYGTAFVIAGDKTGEPVRVFECACVCLCNCVCACVCVCVFACVSFSEWKCRL